MAERTRNEKGQFLNIHGGKHTRLYNTWCSMRERCKNPHHSDYSRYGGRGIRVCEEWDKDYSIFRDWAMQNGYTDNLTIDRIDNNGNYEPCNCRWVTRREQNRNYSRNHFITYNGETKCLSDWADYFGISRTTVLFRLKQGKPLDEVFSTIDGRTIRFKRQRGEII